MPQEGGERKIIKFRKGPQADHRRIGARSSGRKIGHRTSVNTRGHISLNKRKECEV